MANGQSQKAPLSFMDNTGSYTVDGFMRAKAAGAHRVAVCVGYVSPAGLERLADWLDLMVPDGRLLLLVGMAPRNWKFLAQTADAHATYLLRSMQTRAAGLDRALLKRLGALQRAGRLQIRLREPRHQLHAKLYLIESGPDTWTGLAGSSNLSQSGWNAPASQPADDVWKALFNQAKLAGMSDRPASPGRSDGRRSRRSGCWELALGLPLASGLLLLLLSLPS